MTLLEWYLTVHNSSLTVSRAPKTILSLRVYYFIHALFGNRNADQDYFTRWVKYMEKSCL